MGDFITAGDGCRIAYRLDGPEAAPVLLLSNSLGTAMEMWAPQMPALARSFRVLRYDSRGHGQSDAPAGAYSMDRLGRDVIELLDALAIPKVRFCGLSKGGMVGQWLGIRAPERLECLVLANTSPFMGPPSSWDGRIAAVHEGGMAGLVDAVLERWFTPSFLATGEEQIAPVRAMLTATDPGGYAGCCAAIRDMDMRPMLGLITTPTLVIGGSQDPATPPPHSELLASSIASARLVMLPAAHLSNVEQAEAFTGALFDHFAA
ncbi:MAG: 3-oxoadipate enol-lactonase [Sphingobium sp.]|uniref:3-oxoadipate enol-lactonase n=1 Tax=Sphingomonas melonis TaxID=152682 RepID=UPI00037061EA|nr:3-oxoadipate enol-lactonase [Erythrobacter sp.]MBS47084.1 3-oxoadipate enol-lactonase [Sphingobium sp.]